MQLIKQSLIVLIFLISGCCTTPPVEIPVVVQLKILEVPDLRALSQVQKESIEESAFLVLVARETELTDHISKINKMIDVHNKKE